MKKTASLLLATLLGASGIAFAQSPMTSDLPQQAGEMSTMSNGVPNQKTTNSPHPDGASVAVESSTSVMGGPASSELSTSVMGGPPASSADSMQMPSANPTLPNPTGGSSNTILHGSSHPIGTRAPHGYPSIFQGGTPE